MSPGDAEAPVVSPAVEAAGDEGKDRNRSRKQNPMIDGTADQPTRREISCAIGDLMADKPEFGAPEQERAEWLLRKVQLLAEIEVAAR